jgi:hypothetical protein
MAGRPAGGVALTGLVSDAGTLVRSRPRRLIAASPPTAVDTNQMAHTLRCQPRCCVDPLKPPAIADGLTTRVRRPEAGDTEHPVGGRSALSCAFVTGSGPEVVMAVHPLDLDSLGLSHRAARG